MREFLRRLNYYVNRRRFDAELLYAFGFAGPFVFHRIVDTHVRCDELKHVFITGDDDDIVASLFRLAS